MKILMQASVRSEFYAKAICFECGKEGVFEKTVCECGGWVPIIYCNAADKEEIKKVDETFNRMQKDPEFRKQKKNEYLKK